MKNFKKRTIALVLASVVTVVGAFGEENYKNSLMGIVFDTNANNSVNMTLQTKIPYQGNISPIKRDANTYVITLPEFTSEAATPDLSKVSGNISSITIRTMPYSNNNNGYTRITIKTYNPSLNIAASSSVFLPETIVNKPVTNNNLTKNIEQKTQNSSTKVLNSYEKRARERKLQEEEYARQLEKYKKEKALKEAEEAKNKSIRDSLRNNETKSLQNKKVSNLENNDHNTSNNQLLLMLSVLIILASTFFYVRAKNNMHQIAGETLDIDVSDVPSKRKKLKEIKKTIKTIDSAYVKGATMVNRQDFTALQSNTPVKPAEELNIVDLDELFNKQKNTQVDSEISEEENAALEDFLSGFSFDEEFIENIEEVVEETVFDEEIYNRIINNKNIKFSSNDIKCMNALVNNEIDDNTIKNIAQYTVTNPIDSAKKRKYVLEDIVTTYSISHGITFNQEDLEILNKLINVEIDSDFLSDLRTNSERTKQMQEEISNPGERRRKPSEIITLNVKDMLPNLSEALVKQGNKAIESNYKPETVYFSEGYEVNKLKVNDILPDLTKEINNKESFVSKPSASFQYIDDSYEVSHLSIANELPDLADAIANPDKYITKEPEKFEVNEDALLASISNVQFKPFYDGSEEFEVINDFENIPSVLDIQKEMSQFANFEINNEEMMETSLYTKEIEDEAVIEELPTSPNIVEKSEVIVAKRTSQAVKDLMQKIETTKIEREKRRAKIIEERQIANNTKREQIDKHQESTKCILEGESYNVVSSTIFVDNMGCHLAKNESGFAVLGYIGDKLYKLKEYSELKSQKIQTRLNESLPDGTLQYIVRIGLNKFLVNVSENNIQYVMDL